MNLKTWFERGPMLCETREAAAEWFEKETLSAMAATGEPRDKVEEAIRTHLGYASGYFDLDIAERVFEFWHAPHPMFGTPAERARYTQKELEAIGRACGKIAAGDVKMEA